MFFKKKITIVTHDGNFHADDIFAVATLCLVLENKNDIKIVRTRDSKIINKADYVVDVGHIYNRQLNRFDHHQGDAGNHENGIPFASFGLVWDKYGLELSFNNKHVFNKIKEILVFPIDSMDNGIDLGDKSNNIKLYNIKDLIRSSRPILGEDSSLLYANFLFLVNLAKFIIKREVIYIKDNLDAYNYMEEIYSKSIDKRLLIIDKPYNIDYFSSSKPDILLVIYPKKENNNWVIECARNNIESYGNRIYFPESWAGKRDVDLEKETGIKGAIFCHIGRFLFVAKTREAVIEVANKILN